MHLPYPQMMTHDSFISIHFHSFSTIIILMKLFSEIKMSKISKSVVMQRGICPTFYHMMRREKEKSLNCNHEENIRSRRNE